MIISMFLVVSLFMNFLPVCSSYLIYADNVPTYTIQGSDDTGKYESSKYLRVATPPALEYNDLGSDSTPIVVLSDPKNNNENNKNNNKSSNNDRTVPSKNASNVDTNKDDDTKDNKEITNNNKNSTKPFSQDLDESNGKEKVTVTDNQKTNSNNNSKNNNSNKPNETNVQNLNEEHNNKFNDSLHTITSNPETNNTSKSDDNKIIVPNNNNKSNNNGNKPNGPENNGNKHNGPENNNNNNNNQNNNNSTNNNNNKGPTLNNINSNNNNNNNNNGKHNNNNPNKPLDNTNNGNNNGTTSPNENTKLNGTDKESLHPNNDSTLKNNTNKSNTTENNDISKNGPNNNGLKNSNNESDNDKQNDTNSSKSPPIDILQNITSLYYDDINRTNTTTAQVDDFENVTIPPSDIATIVPTNENTNYTFVMPSKAGKDNDFVQFHFVCGNKSSVSKIYTCGGTPGGNSRNYCPIRGDDDNIEGDTIYQSGSSTLCLDFLQREEFAPKTLFTNNLCPDGTDVISYYRYNDDGTRNQECDTDGCIPCSTSGTYSNVNFRTLDDSTSYKYNGQCDLVMASSKERYGGLDIHIRTRIVVDAPPPGVTLISRIGIKIGDDIFEVSNSGEISLNRQIIYKDIRNEGKNGKLNDLKFKDNYTVQKSSALMYGNIKTVILILQLDDGEQITIILYPRKLDFSVDKLSLPDTNGMLGKSDRIGQLVGRDGTTIFTNINDYANEWQVNSKAKNIDKNNLDATIFKMYQTPQYPESCILP